LMMAMISFIAPPGLQRQPRRAVYRRRDRG